MREGLAVTYADLLRVMLAHGVTRRQAYAVISELRGSDPVARLEQHRTERRGQAQRYRHCKKCTFPKSDGIDE